MLSVTDPIKESTQGAIDDLHKRGLRIVMATGDGKVTASAVARQLGIDEVHSEVTPQEKLDLISKLQEEGHKVAMAGDGINDAPALAAADFAVHEPSIAPFFAQAAPPRERHYTSTPGRD